MSMKELNEYINSPEFKEALAIPANETLELTYLARGEYNINYRFRHPVSGEKLVLRVNCGSQMHLDNQIEYEYRALVHLQASGRTPKPLFVDGSKKKIASGLLVMEFLEGSHLDYEKDLGLAASLLADIHKIQLDDSFPFIKPENPLAAILDECDQMIETYYQYKEADKNVVLRIKRMMEKTRKLEARSQINKGYRCLINTELNSTNFLINGKGRKNYLVDWEKPIISEPAQDLGHFLAPTTTFWKTDVILKAGDIEGFLDAYSKAVNNPHITDGIAERTKEYISITCLRGITWCAMAFVQYQDPQKTIKNKSTLKKLYAYLDCDFLDYIEREFLDSRGR